MRQKSNYAFLTILLLLVFPVAGCAAVSNARTEAYQYKQLDEAPGMDAYWAIESICSPEDVLQMKEDFQEEATLWQCTAHKDLFIQRDKERLGADIVLNFCKYRDYTAVYTIIAYGFVDSKTWKFTNDPWIIIQNSDAVGTSPEVTIGVNVVEDYADNSTLVVCSFHIDAEMA